MAPPPRTIRTRFLILSDTHAALPTSPTSPFRSPLPDADVLIHCGDLTMNGSVAQHATAVTLLSSVSAPLKIVIPGNHDVTLDRAYYADFATLHCGFAPYGAAQLDAIRRMYVGADAV